MGGSWGKITHAWVPLYPGAKQHRKPQELFAKAVSFWRLPSLQHNWVGIKNRRLSWVLYKNSSSSWKQKGGLLSSYGTIFNRSVEEGYAPESPWFLAKYEQFGKFLRAACWMVLLKVVPAMVKAPTVKASSRKPTGPTPLSTPLVILEQTDEPIRNRPCGLQGEESKIFSRNSVITSLLSKQEEREVLVAHNQM